MIELRTLGALDLKAADGYRAAIAVLTTDELSVTEEHWAP